MVDVLRRVAEWLIKISGDSSGAVAAIEQVEASTEEATATVTESAEQMAAKQEAYTQSLNRSVQVLSTATSAMASTFSAYMTMLAASDAALLAQEKYNEAVAQYGESSKQAQDAARNLEGAERRATASTVMFGANLLHTASVMFTSGVQMVDLMKKMELLSKVQTLLNSRMALGLGIFAAITFFMLAINSESETMRNIFMVLTGVAVAFSVALALVQLNLAGVLGMTGVGLVAVAAGVAAMVGVVAMQKKQASELKANQADMTAGLNARMADYQPGDIIVNNYITAERIDWEAAPVLLEQLSRQLQDGLERRCKTLGASL